MVSTKDQWRYWAPLGATGDFEDRWSRFRHWAPLSATERHWAPPAIKWTLTVGPWSARKSYHPGVVGLNPTANAVKFRATYFQVKTSILLVGIEPATFSVRTYAEPFTLRSRINRGDTLIFLYIQQRLAIFSG
jgi:hypothetical protein